MVEKPKRLRKRTDGDKGFEDYLVKKLQYIQQSYEQDKEALCIKADRVWMDAQSYDIENERLCLETIREEGRIMTMDTSAMNEKRKTLFWKSQGSNPCKTKIRVNSWLWPKEMMSCRNLVLVVNYFRVGVWHM